MNHKKIVDNYTINARDFIHEHDKAALDTLKGIPGFDQFVKAYMKIFDERANRILNMSSKVKLSPEQCPRIYNLLVPICEKMHIEVPELFLELDRSPNAYTSGDTYVFITVTTGLLELMNDEEIQTVLAHECGHIICHHVLYHTMGRALLSGAAGFLGLNGLLTTALSTAFAYWMRCSEFSADRAAAVFCDGSDRVVDVMLRLAGGGKDISSEINADLFMAQAAEYEVYVNDSTFNKILEFIVLMEASHPFLSVRAASITAWCKSEKFIKISDGLSVAKTFADNEHCFNCGAKIDEGWAFCRKCGHPIQKNS